MTLATQALAACQGETPSGDEHEVFFVGYVYDGASGARLKKEQITAVSVKYRDKVIPTEIEPDGRFVTKAALPTWQDYAVYIGAAGYRPFVSLNPGIDVPSSLSMTDGLVGGKTTQTFQMEARLFPLALKAPKVTLTIEQSDALSADVPLPRASGQVRLEPKALSVLEGAVAPSEAIRRWYNHEDLQNQTVTKPFAEGTLELAEGELVYGVSYDITVFGVPGYQPTSFQEPFVAGQVASRTLVLQKEQKDPLRILASSEDECIPPAGTSNEFGATIAIDFNEPVEFANATSTEDIDNGLSVAPTGFSGSSGTYCSLKLSTSPTTQERGSQATIAGKRLTLAFNPTVGFARTDSASFPCVVPANLTRVTYGNLQNVMIRPVGDASRKKTLAELLAAFGGSGFGSASQLVCGSSPNGF